MVECRSSFSQNTPDWRLSQRLVQFLFLQRVCVARFLHSFGVMTRSSLTARSVHRRPEFQLLRFRSLQECFLSIFFRVDLPALLSICLGEDTFYGSQRDCLMSILDNHTSEVVLRSISLFQLHKQTSQRCTPSLRSETTTSAGLRDALSRVRTVADGDE